MVDLIDGKKLANEILSELTGEIADLKKAGIQPRLIVVLVGQDPSSVSYVRAKKKRGEEIGIHVDVKSFDDSVSQQELVSVIKKFNSTAGVCGILVQLPLPEHIDPVKVLDVVDPDLDVDCLTSKNKRDLIDGKRVDYLPPAVAAVLKILDHYNVDLKNSNVLLVGSGDLIGKPMAAVLLHKGIDFEMANRYTENLPELVRQADVIVSGVGNQKLSHCLPKNIFLPNHLAHIGIAEHIEVALSQPRLFIGQPCPLIW